MIMFPERFQLPRNTGLTTLQLPQLLGCEWLVDECLFLFQHQGMCGHVHTCACACLRARV